MNMVCVKELTRNYSLNNGEREVKVLKNISFEVQEGTCVAIMGRSGCGKTTLLKLLGLVDRPTAGEIIYKGKRADRLSVDELAQIRRNEVGFVFQDFYLLDSLTVLENIMLPMIMNRENAEKMKQEATKQAERFSVSHLLSKHPNQLSGGEKQRVAICRALLNNPDLILADEPTGNLDSKSSKIVIDTLTEINKTFGKTIIMVTHDPIVASHCEKVIFLCDGQIAETAGRSSERSGFYREIVQKMENM